MQILWNDRFIVSKSHKTSPGELYLRVAVTGGSGITKFWGVLMNDCLPIMDLIDWTRSHPDNINQFCLTYGIGSGWKFFLNVIIPSLLLLHVFLLVNCIKLTCFMLF